MKITEIHIYVHDLPVKNGPPYTMANAQVWALDTTLVKLVSDTGHVAGGVRPARLARPMPRPTQRARAPR